MGKPQRFEDKLAEMTSHEHKKQFEKFRKRVLKTFVEPYILYLIATEGPQYGYALRDRIAVIFGVKLSKTTCYLTLYRLEGEYLVSEVRKLSPRRFPHRRYYSLTEKGKELLTAMLNYLEMVTLPKIEEAEQPSTKTKKRFIHPTS